MKNIFPNMYILFKSFIEKEKSNSIAALNVNYSDKRTS